MRATQGISGVRETKRVPRVRSPAKPSEHGHVTVQSLACSLVDALLELKPHPTLIVDAAGRVVAANATARGLIARSPNWSVGAGGEIRCRIAQLPALISALAASKASACTRVAHMSCIADGQQSLVVVAKLAAGSSARDEPRMASGDPQVPTLVLVTLYDSQSRRSIHDPQVLLDAFDLTRTEARIALQLLDGHSPQDIATAAGQKISTVRWHLRNVLAKTGSAKRSDLIRSLASLYYL